MNDPKDLLNALSEQPPKDLYTHNFLLALKALIGIREMSGVTIVSQNFLADSYEIMLTFERKKYKINIKNID